MKQHSAAPLDAADVVLLPYTIYIVVYGICGTGGEANVAH